EKLSSLTPMVLRFSRGRVGSRLFKPDSLGSPAFFLGNTLNLACSLFPFIPWSVHRGPAFFVLLLESDSRYCAVRLYHFQMAKR
ncbi:hypothetical protein, partial [uncultured Alistipes sp.]|uniref:hypothetical protein n=1 Tax=uncultured Alistipes sp. TaxID=538949 RepID=UPI0025A35DBA